jgi:hypothetical protein
MKTFLRKNKGNEKKRWSKTIEQDIFFSPGLVVRLYSPLCFYKIGNNKKIEMPLAWKLFIHENMNERNELNNHVYSFVLGTTDHPVSCGNTALVHEVPRLI